VSLEHEIHCAIKNVISTCPLLPIRQTKRWEPRVSLSLSRYASPIITVRTRMSSTDVLVFDTANDSTSKTKSLNGGDCSLSAISPVVLHASIVGSFGFCA